VKQELSESQTNEKGKILASSFVKAGSIKGDSKVGLSDAVLQEQQDAADEVDEDRIPRAASEAVKNYFQTLKDDSK
jgi:polyhydroxyalkanoate synthesis regulator phasin